MPDSSKEKPTLCDSAAAPGAMKRGRVGRAGGKLKMTLAARPISNVQNNTTNDDIVYNINIQLYNQHSYTHAYNTFHIITLEHISISQQQSGKAGDDPGRPPSVTTGTGS